MKLKLSARSQGCYFVSQYLYRFALMVCLMFGFSFCLPLSAENHYEVVSIESAPLKQSIERTGVLAFKRAVNLSFKSRGYLSKLNVDEGDLFLNNQLLAALDLVELKANKNAAYAKLRQAKNDVERTKTLLAKNLSSEQALEQIKTSVDTARAAYKVAYYNLEKAEIRSSFTGIVLKRYSDLGELQSPERVILKVAALENNIVVNVSLTGQEISNVLIGQQANVILPNRKKVRGVVSKISVEADLQSHLFNVEILLPAVAFNNGAIAGQLAEVSIETATDNSAYRIPIKALVAMNIDGQALLMIQSSNNGEVEQQAFPILQLDNDYIYVLATSHETLNVITQGWQQLTLLNRVLE